MANCKSLSEFNNDILTPLDGKITALGTVTTYNTEEPWGLSSGGTIAPKEKPLGDISDLSSVKSKVSEAVDINKTGANIKIQWSTTLTYTLEQGTGKVLNCEQQIFPNIYFNIIEDSKNIVGTAISLESMGNIETRINLNSNCTNCNSQNKSLFISAVAGGNIIYEADESAFPFFIEQSSVTIPNPVLFPKAAVIVYKVATVLETKKYIKDISSSVSGGCLSLSNETLERTTISQSETEIQEQYAYTATIQHCKIAVCFHGYLKDFLTGVGEALLNPPADEGEEAKEKRPRMEYNIPAIIDDGIIKQNGIILYEAGLLDTTSWRIGSKYCGNSAKDEFFDVVDTVLTNPKDNYKYFANVSAYEVTGSGGIYFEGLSDGTWRASDYGNDATITYKPSSTFPGLSDDEATVTFPDNNASDSSQYVIYKTMQLDPTSFQPEDPPTEGEVRFVALSDVIKGKGFYYLVGSHKGYAPYNFNVATVNLTKGNAEGSQVLGSLSPGSYPEEIQQYLNLPSEIYIGTTKQFGEE